MQYHFHIPHPHLRMPHAHLHIRQHLDRWLADVAEVYGRAAWTTRAAAKPR